MSHDIIPPWARGPLELLRHADGHLKVGGDTDRRIALIGFDQAVETSIEVYVRLHPRLRRGKELPREIVDKALRNFYSKVEFLETHLAEEGNELGVSIEAIVWYHALRNELYHSGNGMVPELHVLQGAREAAVRVFASVFGQECAAEFAVDKSGRSTDPDAAVVAGGDPAMMFLSKFIQFERLLRTRVGIQSPRDGPHMVWRRFQDANPDLGALEPDVRLAIDTRNRIVHHAPSENSKEDIRRATEALWRVTDAIRGRSA